jgi:hypothetical protein
MNAKQVETVFRQVYSGDKNVITPNVHTYIQIGEYGLELSSGEDWFGGPRQYGVRVLKNIESDAPEKATALSWRFDSMSQALEYIDHFRHLESRLAHEDN